MPRPVATPQQVARAQAETGGIKPGQMGGLPENRILGVRGLRKAERKALERGGPEIYIYNVSPVWTWERPVEGRGTVKIPARKPEQVVSEALVLPAIIVRDYDAGNRLRQQYTEEGESIAEDILCCSKEMPGLPQNDLTGYGCFYLVGKRFEELSKTEQDELIADATFKHDQKCMERVLEADQMADSERTRGGVVAIDRRCAVYLASKGDKSIYERRWVSARGKEHKPKVVECAFCGTENKPNIAICPTCKNVIDQARYDELTKKAGKTASA
jgi:hypothetical protein